MPRKAPSELSSSHLRLSFLFSNRRRGWILPGGLWRRIGRSLVIAGAGPHDDADDDQRCHNGGGNHAGLPVSVIASDVSSISGRIRSWRERINIGRPLRARIEGILLGH
jgi:hypothetical protein